MEHFPTCRRSQAFRNRKPETGNRKPETGNRKPETGNRKPETGDGAGGKSPLRQLQQPRPRSTHTLRRRGFKRIQRELTPFSRWQFTEVEIAETFAMQREHRRAEVGKHPADLMI